MKKYTKPNQVVIYQAKSGAIELRQDFGQETVWATQAQIADTFDVDVRTVNEHIGNIYKTKELIKKPTIRNFRIVQQEGKRSIERSIQHYNLDLILSVGYRINSKKATRFRQWATKTLRQHIVEGYTINKSRISQNNQQLLEALKNIQELLPSGTPIDIKDVLELVNLFADTWLSLEAYDKDALPKKGVTKKRVVLTAERLHKSLTELKHILMQKGEVTELFGAERDAGNVAGIVGNVMQAFDGKDVYETAEEKAAHLLYFMVKNHPFTDGNKRNGAYAFVWFLREVRILDVTRLTPAALTALTILVAESNPKDKEKIVRLMLTLLMGAKK